MTLARGVHVGVKLGRAVQYRENIRPRELFGRENVIGIHRYDRIPAGT